MGIPRIRVKTWPNSRSQRAGWTARVKSSVGIVTQLAELQFGDHQGLIEEAHEWQQGVCGGRSRGFSQAAGQSCVLLQLHESFLPHPGYPLRNR